MATTVLNSSSIRRFDSIIVMFSWHKRETSSSNDVNRRIDHDRGIFPLLLRCSFIFPSALRVYRCTMQTKLASQCAAAAAGKLGKQLCEQYKRAATSFALPRYFVVLPISFSSLRSLPLSITCLHYEVCMMTTVSRLRIRV